MARVPKPATGTYGGEQFILLDQVIHDKDNPRVEIEITEEEQ